jgi:DNA-binding NtrC family response regulator/pSer/pThr/pTyr-binding forkhead associated (FHA) protein
VHVEELSSTTPEQSEQPDSPQQDEVYLFVVLETDRAVGGGARYRLDVDEVVVGRGADRRAIRQVDGARRMMELRIPAPLLSTSHARFVRAGNVWFLEDAGSRNGTALNGRACTQRTALRDGDWIELGRVFLRFRTLRVGTDPASLADIDGLVVGQEQAFSTLLPELGLELLELERIAASTLPVVLLGESGTGKELLARGIHAASRRPGPFVAVNCGALSGTLLDSQLFGHSRGSFTGATRDEPGFVRSSDTGTLFLDEIGDLPPAGQVALLRVLEEHEVVPVGATRPVKVDLRIITATHRQIDLLSARGDFRADLYSRLSGHLHYLTPLRERREDLGLIVAELLRRTGAPAATRLTAEAGRELVANDWPLNVRQLEQALARAMTLADDHVLTARHLFVSRSGTPTPAGPSPATESATDPLPKRSRIDDAERAQTLRELLSKHRGNVSEVARVMGFSRVQIHRWMDQFGLDIGTFRR